MIRYFKQEELTKETITEDGWYKTGDIGQWESDGTLSIIDRIKNLVSFPMFIDDGKADSRSNCKMENILPLISWNPYTKPAVCHLDDSADIRRGPVHLHCSTTLRRQADRSHLPCMSCYLTQLIDSTKVIFDISSKSMVSPMNRLRKYGQKARQSEHSS